MECKKYHATIPESTCIARQKRAATKWEPGVKGEADPGCKDCEQGRKVMEEQAQVEVGGRDEHRTSNVQHRTSNEENKKTRTCKKCGHVGPLDDFTRNKTSKYGRTHECRKCNAKRSAINEQKRLKKREAEITTKIIKKRIGEKQPWALKPEDKILQIDFGDYPELYDTIIKIAQNKIRSPEGQCLYLLKETIGRDVGTMHRASTGE